MALNDIGRYVHLMPDRCPDDLVSLATGEWLAPLGKRLFSNTHVPRTRFLRDEYALDVVLCHNINKPCLHLCVITIYYGLTLINSKHNNGERNEPS